MSLNVSFTSPSGDCHWTLCAWTYTTVKYQSQVFRSGNTVGHSVTKVSAGRAQNSGDTNSCTLLLQKGLDSPVVKEMIRNDVIKCITYLHLLPGKYGPISPRCTHSKPIPIVTSYNEPSSVKIGSSADQKLIVWQGPYPLSWNQFSQLSRTSSGPIASSCTSWS